VVKLTESNAQQLKEIQKRFSKDTAALQDVREKANTLSAETNRLKHEIADRATARKGDLSNAEQQMAEEAALFRQKAITVSERAASLATQADAAAGIFSALKLPDVANVASKVSAASNLVSGLAASTINPAALLPTVSSALSAFGIGGAQGRRFSRRYRS